MNEITNQAMVCKGFAGVLGVLLPILVLLIWKKKIYRSGRMKPAIVGAVTFCVFSQMLEGLPKYIFFGGSTDVSEYVWTHAWAYVLAGCLMAGIFEETGKFIAFRFFLKDCNDKKDAITYGVGYGGIEAVLVLGVAAVSGIGIAIAVNNGSFADMTAGLDAIQMKSIDSQVANLTGYGIVKLLLEVLERILAMVLQISLSIVIFRAVKQRQIGYLFLAIALHGIFDVPAALYQCGVLSIGVTEVLLCIAAIGCALYARMIYIKKL